MVDALFGAAQGDGSCEDYLMGFDRSGKLGIMI